MFNFFNTFVFKEYTQKSLKFFDRPIIEYISTSKIKTYKKTSKYLYSYINFKNPCLL